MEMGGCALNSQLALTMSGQLVILIAAVLGYLSTRKKVGDVHGLAQKTEKLVNNQLDRQLRYNGQLAAALRVSGVPVPEQEAAPPPDGGV